MRKHLALLTNEVSRFKSFNEAPHLARKCATRRIDSPCNTLFFKKKESYKFIYLNKYLIVHYMPMHIFLCVVKCSDILFCR
jgi:hypothetical protein